MTAPLNGSKTHPLTEAALSALAMLRDGPMPSQGFNAGIVNRLQRGDLAKIVDLPSPYRTHRRKDGYVKSISHLEITDAGRAALALGQAVGDSE